MEAILSLPPTLPPHHAAARCSPTSGSRGGFRTLKRTRFTEPLGLLATNLAYVEGMGARINAVLIRDSHSA